MDRSKCDPLLCTDNLPGAWTHGLDKLAPSDWRRRNCVCFHSTHKGKCLTNHILLPPCSMFLATIPAVIWVDQWGRKPILSVLLTLKFHLKLLIRYILQGLGCFPHGSVSSQPVRQREHVPLNMAIADVTSSSPSLQVYSTPIGLGVLLCLILASCLY